MQITKNTVVSIDYTLTGPDGQLLDHSGDRGPLSYLHGQGQIIPGLEATLEGKSPGDHFNTTIQPEDAYGPRRDELVFSVPRHHFQGAPHIEPGMRFRAHGPAGTQIVTVVDVQDDQVTVDANHPLAGLALAFDVTVVSVRPATPEEIEQGQVLTDEPSA